MLYAPSHIWVHQVALIKNTYSEHLSSKHFKRQGEGLQSTNEPHNWMLLFESWLFSESQETGTPPHLCGQNVPEGMGQLLINN